MLCFIYLCLEEVGVSQNIINSSIDCKSNITSMCRHITDSRRIVVMTPLLVDSVRQESHGWSRVTGREGDERDSCRLSSSVL